MTRQQIANRIKGLKKTGDNFLVKTNSERVMAKQESKHMKRYGLIDFEVASHNGTNGDFNIFRI